MSDDHISVYFTYHEALYLPTWKREATEQDGLTDEVKQALIEMFAKMDKVREHFKAPINVHVAFRPEAYNKLIGGAPNSAHKYGKAVDFDIEGWNCDKAREEIINKGLLESLDLRMEKNPGGSWIHLGNDYAPGHNRYFLP